MDKTTAVDGELSCFGSDQAPAWQGTVNANRLCGRCESIDWDPALLYLTIADEYSFYPKVQLYTTNPTINQLRTAAHAGCHLCTLILIGLSSQRYRYSIGVDAVPDGLDTITDATCIEINIEGMARSPPVYLTISMSNQGKLFGWHDMSLPLVPSLADTSADLPNTLSAHVIAREWLQECLQKHQPCSSDVPQLPHRIINVTKDTLRLEQPEGRRALYATLSYTIGGAHLFTTTSQTLKDRKAGFDLSSLPQTAQDAVWWTRELGLDYLWLDSLCILQDNLSDWELELSSMADIYRKSTVTIAATRAANAHEGCLPSGNKLNMIPCSPREGICILPDYARESWIFLKSTLDTRAWCFQEIHLAARVLRVSAEELAWQCRTCKRLESNPGVQLVHDIQDNVTFFGSRPLDARFREGDRPFKLWYALVQNFGRRNLSFAADILPAFSGMAQHFQAILKASYVAGLWQEDIHRGLMWPMSEPGQHVAYRSPSWSWAAVEGGYLGWHVWLYNATEFEADVLDLRVRVEGLDPFGRVSSGKLTLLGHIAPIPSFFHDDESEVGSVDWRPHLLTWDRVEAPVIGSVLLRLHHNMCLILQPVRGRNGLWTRIGTLATAMEDERKERITATIGLLDSYEWRLAVVSIV